MPYARLLNEGRINPHTFSHRDIEDYVATAEPKLRDAAVAGLSADGRYIFAYDAVRSVAQAVMAAEGKCPPSASPTDTYRECARNSIPPRPSYPTPTGQNSLSQNSGSSPRLSLLTRLASVRMNFSPSIVTT